MLEESELNIKEPALDQMTNKSADQYVDDLLNKHKGIPEDALAEVQKQIEDGYTSKEMFIAKQKLQDILEKSKHMSKTREFMEDIFKEYDLQEKNIQSDKEKDSEKLNRNDQLKTLINNRIPPSVLLSNKELIFKTDLRHSDDKIEKLEKELSNPFLRASDRAKKKQELEDLKRNPKNFYMFRVDKVTPKEVITSNYHSGMEPKTQHFSFSELKDIIDNPVNAGNAQKAYSHFPETDNNEQWKNTLFGDFSKIKMNFEDWLNRNREKYDLDNYTRQQQMDIFKSNVVYQHNIEQAIKNLRIKPKQQKDTETEAISEDDPIYRDSSDNNPENIQKMRDYLKANGLDPKAITYPFKVKNETDILSTDEWYVIEQVPFDPSGDRLVITNITTDGRKGLPIDVTTEELRYAIGKGKDLKYRTTANADLRNIDEIKAFLKKNEINDKYIDMPFIVKDEKPKNKWAAKGNENIFLPSEHRYVITGVPLNPMMKTLKVKEVLPTGMRGIEKELPIDVVKQSILDNEVDYNTMIDPRNGEVIDIALDPKLRAMTYTHGAQGRFYPIRDDHVIKLLEIASDLKDQDGKPLYAFDLVSSFNYGKDNTDVKNAVRRIWDLLDIPVALQVKDVKGKLKFYYTLKDTLTRTDGTSSMISKARRKEGIF